MNVNSFDLFLHDDLEDDLDDPMLFAPCCGNNDTYQNNTAAGQKHQSDREEGNFQQGGKKSKKVGGGNNSNNNVFNLHVPVLSVPVLPVVESLEAACLRSGYQLGALLGTGKFADVYRAQNLHTHESCVLKVVDAAHRSYVLKEIACMRAVGLAHPHVVGLRNSGEIQRHGAAQPTLVLELEECHEEDFCDFVMKYGALDELAARYYFQQLLLAIRDLHARNVFHLDLKLDNLLLTKDLSCLKVGDFGLSELWVGPTATAAAPTYKGRKGTKQFMSPEVYEKSAYDPAKADVWSLGVVLYCMLTASFPFKTPRKHNNGIFWTEGLSHEAITFLRRIFVVDPSQRPNVEELLADPWLHQLNPPPHAAVEYMTKKRRVGQVIAAS